MDLVGDMLCSHLRDQHASSIVATQVVPVARKRFSYVPFLPEKLTRNADRLIDRFVDYPSWLGARRNDYDLFHLVDHSYSQLVHALPRKQTVVTCHDLDTFRCLLDPEREPRSRWFRAMVRKILDGFRQASHVIAVSNATRDEILRYGLLTAERVTVVSNGVHPACSPLPNPSADSQAEELMPETGCITPWLLSVSNTLSRKRLDVLLKVFAAILRSIPEARLVRVGGFTPSQRRLATELKVEEAIIHVPFLERDVLAAVYRRATLLLLTSEAEGFGLPVIEAMACGCPVVSSDLTVLREVGGAAASYCGVGDVDAWTQTALSLLAERTFEPERWKVRLQRGLAQASGFSWRENARQTALIYQKVLELG
jgi:glycosyltransferase involved in cell wall biosynthesis